MTVHAEFSLMLFGHIAKSRKIKDCGDIVEICNGFSQLMEENGYRVFLAPQPPPVQSDEVREGYNIAKEIVQAAAGLRSKRHGCDRDDLILVTAAELSKIINSVIRAAEQRVAPQTGVPEIEKEYDKLREMHERNDLTDWGDGRFHGIKFCYEALTAHSKETPCST